jgi:hypothetical protein
MAQHRIDFLIENGIVPKIPTIRSSDFQKAMSDPFGYYLTRRLGLADPLRWSEALSQGSWFHSMFERVADFDSDPDNAELEWDSFVAHHRKTLKAACVEAGLGAEAVRKFLHNDELAQIKAGSCFAALMNYPVPGMNNQTLKEWLLDEDRWTCLGTEIEIASPQYLSGLALKNLMVARFDALMVQKTDKGHALWIVDPKTCSGSARDRLQTCPIEFQTCLYLTMAHRLVYHYNETDVLPHPTMVPVIEKLEALGVPRGTLYVAGMIHVAVRKCPLVFGMKDRPHEEYEHRLKTGPRRGQIEIRKKYLSDEPSPLLYGKRCHNWYFAEGEFTHLRDEHEQDPPVNMSIVYFDGSVVHQAMQMVVPIAELAQREPDPLCFMKNHKGVQDFSGNLTKFAPFYLTEYTEWPNLIASQGLVQRWRDEELMSELNDD